VVPVSLVDDLLAEGEPEKEFDPGIAARVARKRVAAGALIRDGDGRILFVEPNYKPVLDIPGGIAEDGESPYAACVREVREELGLGVPIGDLLIVDWTPRQGVWGDGLAFIFDGGVVDRDSVLDARLQRDPEIENVMFLSLQEASGRLRPSMIRRIEMAMSQRAARYSEFGRAL
jgi:ADP-ribose pyrophosphatase YjhB (NUDIX family)